MSIVTLTTDWATGDFYISSLRDDTLPEIYPIGDHYIAQLKGLLLQAAPSAVIVDISHRIQAFNVVQAAFVLRATYPFYSRGTIHLVGVGSEPSPKSKLVLVQYDGHYFIGANDGLFSMVFDGEPDLIIELPLIEQPHGFRALPAFALAVKSIVEGRDLSLLGKPCVMLRDVPTNATYEEGGISGTVVFIDTYGNLITNVSKDLFEMVGKKRPFKIFVQNAKRYLDRISEYYDEVPMYHPLALFNSSDMLEIAMRNSNMAQLEHLDTRSTIRITFDGSRLF